MQGTSACRPQAAPSSRFRERATGPVNEIQRTQYSHVRATFQNSAFRVSCIDGQRSSRERFEYVDLKETRAVEDPDYDERLMLSQYPSGACFDAER
jgi:hypothetical protein